MRRKHSEITDPNEIQRILSSTNIGRLATNGKDGYPYITPVNFVSLDDKIYFHSAPEGEKLENIKRNPQVCFTVDTPLAYLDSVFHQNGPICHLHQLHHCVIIRGSASVIQDNSLKVSALNALIAKHEATNDIESVTENMPGFKSCTVVEINPVSITAKSDLLQNVPEDDRRAIAKYLTDRNRPGDRETVKAMGV